MGYIGERRSINSQDDIENYIVPKSLLTKSMITDFEKDNDIKDPIILNAPIYMWKLATNYITPASWHHTGKYYRKTYHYNMIELAVFISDNYVSLKKEHKQLLHNINNSDNNEIHNFAVILFNDWTGTRNHPKVSEKQAYGYINGIWLVSYNWNKKFDLTAKKVNDEKDFLCLNDLKKYLGKIIDLRKFEPFLKAHNVNYRKSMKPKLKDKIIIDAQITYPLSDYRCINSDEKNVPIKKIKQNLINWNILKTDSKSLENKYLGNGYEYNGKWTKKGFQFLNKVVKKHGYKLPMFAYY